MVLTFSDLSTQPFSVFDSSVSDPLSVVLDEDIEVSAKHKILQIAGIKNPTISESVLELNMKLSGKGVLVLESLFSQKNKECQSR